MRRIAVALAFVVAAAGCGSTSSAAGGATGIVAGNSQYGTILFSAKKQAIYVFQSDTRRHSNCYGACAAAWPPVYTSAHPRALGGVRKSLLGTIKRGDGRRQVTYAGHPLYYYAHEGRGQVLCHRVFSYGGLWWVVAPTGKHRR